MRLQTRGETPDIAAMLNYPDWLLLVIALNAAAVVFALLHAGSSSHRNERAVRDLHAEASRLRDEYGRRMEAQRQQTGDGVLRPAASRKAA